MKILVVGATGLIGSAICARLLAHGHSVVGIARRQPLPLSGNHRIIALDMAGALTPGAWLPHLAGVDAVINCAGVLQDGRRDDTRKVHGEAAAALFRACEQASIRRVIHFSAIGVERAQPSEFSASKLAGDEALMALDLDWVILRPSVVLGRPVFGASALIRGLAALPIRPVMAGTGPLQVVQLDDVVSTAVELLEPSGPSRIALDLAGPKPFGFDEIVALYRRWFGWPEARRFMLPDWIAAALYRLGDFAGMLGWRPPIRTNAAKEITRGAVGDPTRWTEATGIEPTALEAALIANPATVQERWFAKLYFVKPLVFVVLPFFWLMTGVVSLTTGYENGVKLMVEGGAGALSGPSVVLGAIADIVIGVLLMWRRTTRWGLYGAIGLSIFYAVAGTILRPDLWNEPLGALMKILPIFVFHLAALAILEER